MVIALTEVVIALVEALVALLQVVVALIKVVIALVKMLIAIPEIVVVFWNADNTDLYDFRRKEVVRRLRGLTQNDFWGAAVCNRCFNLFQSLKLWKRCTEMKWLADFAE